MRHTIGIRREDKNEWERRVPIVPDDMEKLIREQGLSFKVQPSMLRIFPEGEFEAAGAALQEDLSDCPVVFAVKEIPLDFYREGTTYIFFSHTVKGQPYNMDMLRHILKLKCNIIDYERIVDDRNRRLIFFGRHAGLAGMVDTLWCLGERLDMEGVDPNPLGSIRQTYHYESLEEVLAHMGEVGDRIREHGFAPNQTPFVIGFAGYGNVSQGAQEILEPLPVESLAPEELAAFCEKGGHDPRKIYKVVFREEHLVKPKQEGAPFTLQEYYDHPERYVSSFDQFLPYMNVLVNCIYWDTPYPRLITKASIKSLYAAPEPPRLKVVGDISCDIEGSIEFTLKATEPDNPVFVYNPEKDTMADGVAGKGPVVMSVDNLPCELSRESSEHFSKTLVPFLPAMAAADYTVPFEKLALPPEIKKAMLIHQGKFTPDYKFMEQFLK